jgi:formate hydrogenlyase subunit 4
MSLKDIFSSLAVLGGIQGILILFGVPFLAGWLNWWKARFTGRRRPWTYLFQPYRDLFKLLRVPATRSRTTSLIFAWTPWIVFLCYGTLLFTLQIFQEPLLRADLILILYLLGLARFTLSLAGLDNASSFGGLGSSREMFFHFLTEVSFFGVIAGIFLWQDSAFLVSVWEWKGNVWMRFGAAIGLILAFFPVLLLEARRIPVDNPETHLELTMAGKAVELEFSGRDLALVEWGETSKLAFMLALWVQLLIPRHLITFSPLLWLSVAVLLVCWETLMPKMRLGRVPQVAGISLLLSLFAIAMRLFQGA